MTANDAARDIRLLSAGTIGTLTGLTNYDEIDSQRENNAICVQYAKRTFDNWMDAWQWIEGQNNAVCGIHNEY